MDDGMMWHEVGEILDRCDPDGDVTFDVDLACDFADELLSLHTSFCGGTKESESPARLLAERRRATVALGPQSLQQWLEHRKEPGVASLPTNTRDWRGVLFAREVPS